MQGKEGEETTRGIAKSRPARNMFALGPALSPSQSSPDPGPVSPVRPEVCCQSLNAVCTERPDELALSTDDMHSSQGRQKEGNELINTGRHGAPNIGGSDMERDLALNNFPDSKEHFGFKGSPTMRHVSRTHRAVSQGQLQGKEDGGVTMRGIAKSRPVRNVVALAPKESSPPCGSSSGSVPVPSSPVRSDLALGNLQHFL